MKVSCEAETTADYVETSDLWQIGEEGCIKGMLINLQAINRIVTLVAESEQFWGKHQNTAVGGTDFMVHPTPLWVKVRQPSLDHCVLRPEYLLKA